VIAIPGNRQKHDSGKIGSINNEISPLS